MLSKNLNTGAFDFCVCLVSLVVYAFDLFDWLRENAGHIGFEGNYYY
jgi:hypothetical protein